MFVSVVRGRIAINTKKGPFYLLIINTMNIYVANIAFSAEEGDLRELFEGFGEVSSAKIILDKETRRSRGFGFVEMADDTEAREAINKLNGSSFQGKTLNVTEARP